ncbi:hypothetical protein [Mesorhizobium sp. B1-1-7]|uniref:hypothetical protein n=1 Tax=Mesorhizobium sp. B1-1-7 TaxID=2589977 RepID=UPI00112D31D7|nr:hypothetical protein [Mesorhizobium sp. B1-1-7]TPN57165.1 hypothetical protein FJ978_00650 [Mesorhizobium sp. B1-1-7]
MSGPFPFARQMMAVDEMVSGAPAWDGLEQAFFSAKVADNFDPGADMKQVLYHFYQTAEGRRIIDWIADLTVRAPYPHIGSTNETAALAAKAHEARAAVGYAIGRAIADGEELYKQSKGATT